MEDWVDETAQALERATGSPMADALIGTVEVVAISTAGGWLRFQSATVELLLDAPGIAREPLTTEVVLDRRYWPSVGTVLRARISQKRPRMIDADWGALAR